MSILNLFAAVFCAALGVGCLHNERPIGFVVCMACSAVNLCIVAYQQGWVR